MPTPDDRATELLVESIIRETQIGSGQSLDDLNRRVSAIGVDQRLVADLASKNPALLGTGQAS